MMTVKLPSSIGVDKLQAWAQSIGCDVQLLRDGHLTLVDQNSQPFQPELKEQPVPHKKKRTLLRLFKGA